MVKSYTFSRHFVIVISEKRRLVMDITKFIKSHKELADLPFLVVYSTIKILVDKGILKLTEADYGMD